MSSDDDQDILSDPEPIRPNGGHEPTPEQATADAPDDQFMEEGEAELIAEDASHDVQEDVGRAFEQEVLEAAATLKEKNPPAYARLKRDIKASDVDTNDWKGSVGDVARELTTQSRRTGDPRPVIRDRADIHKMADEACEALAELDGLYERGGELVEIRDGQDGPEIAPIEKGRILDLLSQAARFERSTQDGAKRIKPPSKVIDVLHSRGNWQLDQLEGFVDGACMLEDGTVLSTEGYHPDANLYLRNGVELSGLRSPDQSDAEEARARLLDLLCDFELVEPNREAHESAWLASLLTMLARPAIGPKEATPLFLYDANRPGVGKTRLVEMAVEIATGRLPTPRPAPSGRNADSEMKKTITAIARAGVPIVFFDNVKGKLGGGALELALTGKQWSSRILGKSKEWSGPLQVTWMATSNNASITPDMRRRTVLCQIETDEESPEERTGFKYPRIQQHIRQNRAQYLKDALTILRAWYVAGKPEYGLTSWGSFEGWGRIIRNAIVFSGGADPYRTRKDLADADREISALRAVLQTWPERAAYSSSEIATGLKNGYLTHEGENYTDIVEVLEEFLPSQNARGIGRKLSYYEDQVEDGRKLTKTREGGTGKRLWAVEAV